MSLNIIKEMKLNDQAGTSFDVSALSNMALKKIGLVDTDLTPPAPNPSAENKNNLVIGANSNPASGEYGLKNTDIKAVKSLRFYTGTDEVKFMADGQEKHTQVHIKACVDKDISKTSKDRVLRVRLGCAELELNGKNAYTADGSSTEVDHMDISFKNDNNMMNGKLKASAIDVRAIAKGKGTGGGIALQIASCDSNLKENKFKIETDRKVDPVSGLCPNNDAYATYYNKEGGTGIEIGTINSQFESLGSREIRRLASADVFAVTRSEVKMFDASGNITEELSSAKKWDYIPQSDDSKDIKNPSQANVKWVDLINSAIYLKAQGLIPADGSIIESGNITWNLTNVTVLSARSCYLKHSEFTQQLVPPYGQTISIGVSSGHTSSGFYDITSQVWNSVTNTLTFSTCETDGGNDFIITASTET